MVMIMFRDSRLADSIAIGISSIFSCLILFDIYRIRNIQNISVISIMSPLIFPFLVDVVTICCILFLICKEIMAYKIQKSSSCDAHINENEYIQDLRKTIIYFLGTLFYILMLIKTNFIISTTIYNFVVMILLYKQKAIKQKLWITMISCLVTVISIYYIFTKIFYVVLP